MAMPMVLYDFETIRGATFKREISLESVTDGVFDLSNYTVQSQVRKNPGTLGDPVATMTCSVSANGESVILLIPASDTRNIKGGTYYYDVAFIDNNDGTVSYILGGQFIVRESVTVIQQE